jgi:hypothetical protein
MESIKWENDKESVDGYSGTSEEAGLIGREQLE